MSQKKKYQAYAAATQTVARTRQIVMLYDGAIRFMQQAKESIHDRRIEDRYHQLVKASGIVNGLQGCLDFEHGGDIAKVLYSFYATLDSKIFSIHRTNSMETCDEVIADLKQMRDVWQEIDQNMTAAESAPASQPASNPVSETELPPPESNTPNITLSA